MNIMLASWYDAKKGPSSAFSGVKIKLNCPAKQPTACKCWGCGVAGVQWSELRPDLAVVAFSRRSGR